MFERFSKDARAAVVLAQEHARDAGADRVAATHLLSAVLASLDEPARAALAALGLTAERARTLSGTVFSAAEEDALRGLGIDLDSVADAVRDRFGADLRRRPGGRRRSGHLPFTRDAKKSLELALREAIRLKAGSIRGEHVLLGALRSDDAEVRAVVDAVSSVPEVRARLVELLGHDAA
ncbi:Clp protease N-terminal domain-containing protein [Nocardioides humi]|uniref:Clp protease N-terminal domain-containing protein n=1 Tax=Nocardioides humi TaxID=449461 RepID=A0ABN1ZVC2_9ACTN|nr:Clp protease N-terminal domain-containing protein [Nocardioides humi]